MRVWKYCASVTARGGMLVLVHAALAAEPCPAGLRVDIGAQQFTVEQAATPATRERGLSGRERLDGNAGMWFVLAETGMPGFWMQGMKFPIDLIWVSPEYRVMGAFTLPICKQDCPIFYPPAPVSHVLETTAGRFSGRIGDRVTWACQ